MGYEHSTENKGRSDNRNRRPIRLTSREVTRARHESAGHARQGG